MQLRVGPIAALVAIACSAGSGCSGAKSADRAGDASAGRGGAKDAGAAAGHDAARAGAGGGVAGASTNNGSAGRAGAAGKMASAQAGRSAAGAGAGAGGSGASGTAGNSASGGTQLAAPSADAVAAAKKAYLVRYARDLPGGAYTNAGNTGGAAPILAFAAYAGDASADARLLEQIRYTITGGNDICANGGYPAQHELQVTGMFAIVKLTPRVWDTLSADEHARIDALMEASLVGSAFTTSDNNPFVKQKTQQYTLDGDSNLDRDWNPNFREGMGSSILVATAYFGGPAAASALLTGYQHEPFVAQLATLGLTNAHQIFNWKVDNASSNAPSGAQIEAAVHVWSLHGVTLDDVMGLEQQLSDNTYGGTVACGLNDGAGILSNGVYGGTIDSGCAGLPNLGKPGMLLEFDSVDAEGKRSSADYAYGGYKPNLIGHTVLLASGLWQPGAVADEILGRLAIGVPDLWYKLDHGYREYSHGKYSDTLRSDSPDFGFIYLRSLWDDVVKPYHGL